MYSMVLFYIKLVYCIKANQCKSFKEASHLASSTNITPCITLNSLDVPVITVFCRADTRTRWPLMYDHLPLFAFNIPP